MDNFENKVLIIKGFHEKGYRQKVIQIITQYNQPYINKVINQKLHQGVQYSDDIKLILSEEQKKRLDAVNRILSCKDIFTENFDQEIIYMKLLRFFLVSKDDIYNLYNYISKRRINTYLVMKKLEIKDFDASLLGIEQEVYYDLIVDYI